jgi:hypothetical protein
MAEHNFRAGAPDRRPLPATHGEGTRLPVGMDSRSLAPAVPSCRQRGAVEGLNRHRMADPGRCRLGVSRRRDEPFAARTPVQVFRPPGTESSAAGPGPREA